ncbi:MAG: formate dehydrogenase accessory sulfurtransferase FdhD [Candidatus Baltobacteraceae bacterium]
MSAIDDCPGRITATEIETIEDGVSRTVVDDVATEEPLEIRLVAGTRSQAAAITMRTPGNDFELAAGFLFSEGIIESVSDILRISYCIDPAIDNEQRYNIINVEFASSTLPDVNALERHFTMTSACGICGKANLEALRDRGVVPLPDGLPVPIDSIYSLPERMRESQRVFHSTGGLHAAALFDSAGSLIAVREDVGRHNALDKLIGWALLNNRLPLREQILMVSGRSSYEILQKTVVAGIPIICGVSAPSSLAVALAREFNVTLIGFLRGTRANVYAGTARLGP